MDFPRMSSTVSDPASDNLRKLSTLFPSIVKDGQVDFDALKVELGQFEEVGKERYELTWAGKQEAMKNAAGEIEGKTLKYIPEESKNPGTTENLYIEGDNLEVLKLLQNSYMGKIGVIYIDPPYNTGKDYIYNDNFRQTAYEAAKEEGNMSENGELYTINTKSSGKYHSRWLSMMYPRLRLAKNVLKHDGVIFISIDDNEVGNLRRMCDEVFGEENFIGLFCRKTKSGGGSAADTCAVEHDYVLAFARNVGYTAALIEEFGEDYLTRYKEVDSDGRYFWDTMERSSTKTKPYKIIAPDGTQLTGKWFRSEETFKKDLERGEVRFLKKDVGWSVQFKQRLSEGKKLRTIIENNDLTDKEYRSLSQELEDIVGCGLGHPPKPVKLMTTLISSVISKGSDNEIVVDFFSGSATTAHAVMQLNAEDDGNRKFIMVQYPEECPEDSEAAEAGYRTISDIGKERIRRAGEKIAKEHPEAKIDIGFKVFKVDNTNIRWIAAENRIGDTTLADAITTTGKDLRDFLPNTKDADIVYEILIRQYDIPLSAKIERLSSIGPRTYSIADALIVCLEENVTPGIIDTVAAIEPVPHKIIFRDSAFDDDIALKENTMMRLDALMQKHARDGKQPYRVEFL